MVPVSVLMQMLLADEVINGIVAECAVEVKVEIVLTAVDMSGN